MCIQAKTGIQALVGPQAKAGSQAYVSKEASVGIQSSMPAVPEGIVIRPEQACLGSDPAFFYSLQQLYRPGMATQCNGLTETFKLL